MWGKQNNYMLQGLTPDNETERDIISRLERIRKSTELEDFTLRIKSEAEELGINHIYSRVKTNNSAIRRYRVGKYSDIKQLDDLCGVMLVAESLGGVYKTAGKVREMLGEPKEFDLNHKFESRGAPPLSYILKSNKRFGDVEDEIPIEIRIQEKKRFFVIESLYYVIYKNDMIDEDLKWHLDKIMMQIMLREFTIQDEKTEESVREKLQEELESLLEDNEALLSSNKHIVYEAWREYARVRFEYMYTQEIEAASLFDSDILEKINNMLIKIFDIYYSETRDSEKKETKFSGGARIEEVLEKMSTLTYSEIIQLIRQEEIAKEDQELE